MGEKSQRRNKGPMGKSQKSVSVDWEIVKKLARMQCTASEIASFLETNIQRLDLVCSEYFEVRLQEKIAEWAEGGKISLRRNQWRMSEQNPTMAIFLGKQYLKQVDNAQLTHKGDIGINIVHYGTGQPNKWSDDPKDPE